MYLISIYNVLLNLKNEILDNRSIDQYGYHFSSDFITSFFYLNTEILWSTYFKTHLNKVIKELDYFKNPINLKHIKSDKKETYQHPCTTRVEWWLIWAAALGS